MLFGLGLARMRTSALRRLVPRRRAQLCAFALALWLLAPSASRAWTEAHVREAHAALALTSAEDVAVELDLALEVRGGWLEQLELPGLDQGLVLAAQEPAVAVLESGEQVPAQVSLRGSTLTLKFARRDGLRRGLHHLHVRYALPNAALVQAGGHEPARLYWTLPGFEAGLTRASVSLLGPGGMRAVDAPEVAQAVQGVARGREHLLTFSRVHVPRATPWTIAVDLPVPQLASPARALQSSGDGAPGAFDLTGSALLVLASVALIAAVRRRVQRALGGEGLSERGLLLARPLPPLALCALSLLAALGFARAPALSLAAWGALFAFGVPQAAPRRGPLVLGSFRPLTREELRAFRRARWRALVGVPWADVHSLLGGLGALGLLSVPVWRGGISVLGREPWGCLSLCALFALLASARGLRPRSLAEQVGQLEAAARSARTVGCALRLVAYESQGRLSQPRLRLEPGVRYPGLLRLEVLADTRRSARPLVLSALVEADSAAERWLSGLWPAAHREHGAGARRSALLMPIDDVGRASEALLEHLSNQSQRLLVSAEDGAHATQPETHAA
jgi:hypothetical protein